MSVEEEDINSVGHKQLLQSVSNLVRTQHIRRATRSEPQLHQDEFQLLKDNRSSVPATNSKHSARLPNSLAVDDVVKLLQTSAKHLDAGKQMKYAVNKKKTLKRPTEKPFAERTKRVIGYENTKKKLARWDAIVAQNRSAAQQVFPLKSETIYVNPMGGEKRNYELYTSFMKNMDALEKSLESTRGILPSSNCREKIANQPAIINKKLKYKDMLAKRRMLAYVRMKESQKSAKARIHNKIKSKKFHKLLKQQKLKEEIKQFELLQKVDPEAALEKLEALEKSRILERANLRHKNTGAWANNAKIRAKYNKQARQDFAEQLEISRQLTQKNNPDIYSNSDDDNVDENEITAVDSKDINQLAGIAENDFIKTPWSTIDKKIKSNDIKSSFDECGNWRKYWIERNKNYKEIRNQLNDNTEKINDEATQKLKFDVEIENKDKSAVTDEANEYTRKVSTSKQNKLTKTKLKTKSSQNEVMSTECGWTVEDVAPNGNIDGIFDIGEYKLDKKIRVKLRKFTNMSSTSNACNTNNKNATLNFVSNESDVLENVNSLLLKCDIKRPLIDEGLNIDDIRSTTITGLREQWMNAQINASGNPEIEGSNKSCVPGKAVTGKQSNEEKANEIINPASNNKGRRVDKDNYHSNLNQYDILELKHNTWNFNSFTSAVANEINADIADDEGRSTEQQFTIAEAFEDDNIIADFAKNKREDIKLKNTEIEINPPGWGSWAGAGIPQEEANKNRYLMLHIKSDKENERRVTNKSNVYLNEQPSKYLREHLVSEIPFPFTSVKDYQASIQSPIGRNYVPEAAFRNLIRPSVITRKGKVIVPMHESELVKKCNKRKNPTYKRTAGVKKYKIK